MKFKITLGDVMEAIEALDGFTPTKRGIRPLLDCINFKMDGDEIYASATDSYMMCIINLKQATNICDELHTIELNIDSKGLLNFLKPFKKMNGTTILFDEENDKIELVELGASIKLSTIQVKVSYPLVRELFQSHLKYENTKFKASIEIFNRFYNALNKVAKNGAMQFQVCKNTINGTLENDIYAIQACVCNMRLD